MSIASEYERIEDGRLISTYRSGAIHAIEQLDSLFSNIKSLVAKYPEDASELNGYVATLKSAVTNVINKY